MPAARHFRPALAAATMLCLWAAHPVNAAEETVPANPPTVAAAPEPAPVSNTELSRFETLLDEHPNLELRLRENPALIENPAFLRNHPLFAQFLAHHPGISAELAARPRWLVHRELAGQPGTALTHAQHVDFDRFLDQHPGVERLLVQHPRLMRQAEFLSKHPELHEYIQAHPGFNRAGELRSERPKVERKN